MNALSSLEFESQYYADVSEQRRRKDSGNGLFLGLSLLSLMILTGISVWISHTAALQSEVDSNADPPKCLRSRTSTVLSLRC